jgi:inosine-uridine nucleoside N-ribohydrolase
VRSSAAAIQFIAALGRRYESELCLVSLAPLSTLATALRRYQELVKQVAYLYVMATHLADSSGSRKQTDFNVWFAARAAQVCFNSGIPVVLLSRDTCQRTVVSSPL